MASTKIKVSNIVPNPYRDLKKFPIDKDKVKDLIESIKGTTFWDNIIVRKKGTKYQLAYGHHRLEAIKKVGIKTIEIPVRKISNAMMIKIMANENREVYDKNPVATIEAVKQSKLFLDNELKKYDSFKLIGLYR